MSTRATFQFNNEWSGTHTAYIHHDGNPQGAANYLTVAIGEKPICDIETFIRANHRAEMTSSHEVHGDTEWQYTIKERRVTVRKYDYLTDTYEDFGESSVADFIKEYAPQKFETYLHLNDYL